MPKLPDRAFLEHLAHLAAAETLPRFRKRNLVENKDAEGFDPVTEADRAAETVLRSAILAEFPDHGIVGEEHGTEGSDREVVWVIDPIDGTRAFISGLPVWGTLVGVYVDGRAKAGFMHQPFTGELFVCDGNESVLIRNGEVSDKLQTSAVTGLESATLFTTTPALYSGQQRERFDALEDRVRLSRYGCDCYAFAMLAAGHADVVVEPGLAPYDIGGLIALIEKAGGVVTTWDGARPEQGGNVIAAANADLHEAACALLAL